MIDKDPGVAAFQRQINVSRETIDRLKEYEALLKKWNPAINLVSKNTLSEIWTRHFLDSAQVWKLRPENAENWLDLGSGAGFPGLVVAILAAEQQSSMKTTLVESDERKSVFLRNAAQKLDIPVSIYAERAEKLIPQKADIISARALAPLEKLFEFAERHRTENTTCLFSKGRSYKSELTNAQKYWTFDVQNSPSLTDSDGVILKIGDFGRV